jgi:predicted dehydrogenase
LKTYSEKMGKIKWGILAPGHISRGFAAALKVTGDADLYAVASRSYEKAASFAQEFGFQKVYGSYSELADDPEVDVIYIATPHHLHFDNAMMCLKKGKPVLCEKPFTINSKQLEILVKTARDKKVFLMEAIWTRFLPGILKTMQLIEEGQIGQVKILNADFGFKADYNPESRLYDPFLGGGSLLDIGIYPVFLSLLLLGYPDKIEAVATKAPTGVDESMSISLSYKNGALASLHCTFAAHTNTDANIYGDKGKIHLKRQWLRANELVFNRNDEPLQELTFPSKAKGYEYEAEEVMRCLNMGLTESPVLGLDFSLQLMKLLDAIRKKSNIVYPDYD